MKFITYVSCGLLAFAGATVSAQETSAPGTIQLTAFKINMTPGDKIGHSENGMFCFDGGTYTYQPDRHKPIFFAELHQAFKREMAAASLPAFQASESAFDTGGSRDPDYKLGATIEELFFDQCTYPGNRKGSLHVVVKWELFSVKQQKVVLTRSIPGDHKVSSFESSGTGAEFESRSFGASLRTLLSDSAFQDQIRGLRAADASASDQNLPILKLKPGSAAALGGAQKNAADLRAAVVSIDNGSDMGSGFYISDGYVLSNRHVVGSSKYVKVKLANGKELVGEVLRQDAPRDVALIKTEAVGLAALRVNTATPAVGGDVFAIGSPLSQQLAGTFTKGVLSGTREKGGLRYLQSDVAVNPGNSGGPLLDGSGAVIGVTVSKVSGAEGLAFFIPIEEAMSKLAFEFDAVIVAAAAPIPSATATSDRAATPAASGKPKHKN